jgi:hypothetical protein
MFEVEQDGRIAMPERLRGVLQVWLWISIPLSGFGLLVVHTGSANGNKWVTLLGLLICVPALLLGIVAYAIVAITLILRLYFAVIRTILQPIPPVGISPSKPSGVPSELLWDDELDG